MEFLEGFVACLRKGDPNLKIAKNAQNTIQKDIAVIRFFFNKAIKEGEFPFEKSPFHAFSVPSERTFKTKLSIEELRALFDLELEPGSRSLDVQNFFKFAFYTGGIRVGDVLMMKWANVINGRLIFQTQKTDDPKSTKLLPAALVILDLYKTEDTQPNHCIFHFLDHERDYSDPNYLAKQLEAKTALINKHLKPLAKKADIEKRVTTHIARHSMADYLRKSGKSVYDISKILGHSDISITETYLMRLDYETVDAAMDALVEI